MPLRGVPAALAALLLVSPLTARAAVIACGTVSAPQGGTATVEITLEPEGDEQVAGTQNDLELDPAVFSIAATDCVINPAIGPGSLPDKTLNTSTLPPGDPNPLTVRNLLASLGNTDPIPAGALYTCTFRVAADAELGDYTLINTRVIASSPTGERYPVTAGDCTINVTEAPTPTPTPECTDDNDCPTGQVCLDGECVAATPTPIGYCTDDEDCPSGQVCVDNRCVTATPTPTPIGYCTDTNDCPEGQTCIDNMCVAFTATPIGYCTDDDDCADGEVCVDNMCMETTPVPRRGGGGGCSCEIDPGAAGGRAADLLAVLLPALVLLLRRRARRG